MLSSAKRINCSLVPTSIMSLTLPWVLFLQFLVAIIASTHPDYLMIVREKNRWKLNSGGVLLSNTYGLTTCSVLVTFGFSSFRQKKPELFEVKWSDSFFDISKIAPHPKCSKSGPTVFFDYAYVRFKKELKTGWTFSNIKLLGAITETSETNKKCVSFFYDEKTFSYRRDEVIVPPSKTCIKLFCSSSKCFKTLGKTGNATYCSMHKKCSEFVGYPLFCDDYFWGLIKLRMCSSGEVSIWWAFDNAIQKSLHFEDIRPKTPINPLQTKTTAVPIKKNPSTVHPTVMKQGPKNNYFVKIMTKYDEDYITTGIVVSPKYIVSNCSPFVTFSQLSFVSSVMDAESIAYEFPSRAEKLPISKIIPHEKCRKRETNIFYDLASLRTVRRIAMENVPKFPDVNAKSYSAQLESMSVRNAICEVTVYTFETNSFQVTKGRLSTSEDCLDGICSAYGSECQSTTSGVSYETLCFFTDKCESIGASPLICDGRVWGISKYTNCELKDDFPILFEPMEHFSVITDLRIVTQGNNKSNLDDRDYFFSSLSTCREPKFLFIWHLMLFSLLLNK